MDQQGLLDAYLAMYAEEWIEFMNPECPEHGTKMELGYKNWLVCGECKLEHDHLPF